MALASLMSGWRGSTVSPVRECLAGMVATFALIPEVIAFASAAGVDPSVGLYASFVISVVIAFAGGRPAMISAAAGSVALVAAGLVHTHGVQYLFAATLLCGAIQVAFGLLRVHVLMRFVARSVRTGFVNALAILIFYAQTPHMIGVSWQTYALIALGLAIIYLVPKAFTAIPSPLICIVVLTVIVTMYPMPVETVADLGRLPDGLPTPGFPHLPLTLQTLGVVAPYAFAMAMVGLLESLMTARVVDDMTGTTSNKRRESVGLGLANFAAGAFGGIGGCGMIGQTVGNVRYGGRGRLSTLMAGVFLLVLIVALRPFIARIPVAALVAIMIMVSISTFSWASLRELVAHPKLASTVMLSTVAVVVATSDLAAGVAVGVLLSGVFFASNVSSMLRVERTLDPVSGARKYVVRGEIFFASAELLEESIDYDDSAEPSGAAPAPPRDVVIDLRGAHLWDITSVGSVETIVEKLRARGHGVTLLGLNEASEALLRRHGDVDATIA
ncbi:sulfate permease [Acetobacter nitrogenifigens DSM 23921 = NBRC 105050]|uniref:Sodium-independent anion transporter n=1 Tax=Acetobacter nitrogenifigens DSM 23921 = NBRC 105050 TaxID=1120919 RepID=A0A511XDB2_9PROT|nr:SulP family inorganic anion transporter [Acetobacter nitrogenifigens]GBQ89931.1 sulfate permease [Acetobacter nitrogenifigens DSM 23921 = NBRC 105050]GEN60949.1 sodium-independent anion transporter [Acetobacter nitrogenifigens DSM 23921 = NBRC 105050]